MQNAAYSFVADVYGEDKTPREFAQQSEIALSSYIQEADIGIEDRPRILTPLPFVSTIFIVFTAILGAFGLYSVIVACDKWNMGAEHSTGKSTLRPPAPTMATRSRAAKMGIVFGLFSGGVIHWIATIIAVDIISYFMVGHAVAFRPTGTVMAMLDLSSEGSQHWFGRTIEFRLLFGMIALPGIFNILMVVQRFPSVMPQGLSRMRRRRLRTNIQSLDASLDAVCESDGSARPELVVLKYGGAGIYSETAFLR